ncbi:MAG: peptidylprolyl isomerase [Gammaproteobacteria bacterium]|nr:peptidylprolyl isomerase [Gammaproteobacteria bacterium]MDP2349453.1 peptidylprolyl isomerase [Gammaproteobacteria bacterium]
MPKLPELRTSLLLPALLLLNLLLTATAGADVTTATQAMENPTNPLLHMRTSRGDVFLELFPAAAPRNVANFVALANAQVPMFDVTTGTTVSPHYYDGLSVHRVLPYFLIQSGAPRQAGTPVPEYQLDDEINASLLGLDQIKVLDEGGTPHPWLNLQDNEDFQQEILAPLYRRMGITSPEMLETRQTAVLSALRELTLQQAYENQGYRYNTRLPSLQPVRGSIAMAGSGPNTNQAEFFITTVDAPWLAGKSTIIGRVVEGMDIVDRINQSAVMRGNSTTPTANSGTMIFDIRQVNLQ